MQKIIILGGLGDGVVVVSIIQDINKLNKNIELLGFLNDSGEKEILGFPVLGKLVDWIQFKNDKDIFFITALLVH